MTETLDIKVTKVSDSHLANLKIEDMVFGKTFTDHMFVAKYKDGKWSDLEIKPYQPISISPACTAIHYGQSIFEGIKAFRNHQTGEIAVFRGIENYKRFNRSAARMCMPEIPEEVFMGGMNRLLDIDRKWVPNEHNYSMYIRPFMFGTDAFLGVHPAHEYLFLIILSPSGLYASKPWKLYTERTYIRAAEGGVGFAKNAGNYGASLYPTELANQKGYDQILWLDAKRHQYIQECGTMNIFFVIGDTVVTPPTDEGTILEGVTRKSVIQLLRDQGKKVEVRHLSIDEVKQSYLRGEVTEVFGTGTAAVVTMVQEIADGDFTMKFDPTNWRIGPAIKDKIDDIREGSGEDTYGWMEVVKRY